VFNEPTSYQQSHRQQDSNNRQPILTCPPQSEQKAHTQHNTSNLAGNDIKTTKGEKGTYEAGPEIASRQSNGLYAALHVRDAAFMRV
jgi:hypothetical protein